MTEASKCSLPPGSAAAKPRLLVRTRASPTRHPASLPEISPPWALTLSGGLPCPQRSGGRTSPRRPRGALPASSPFRTPPAACPLKRRGAVARDAPLRAASRAYRPTSRARRSCVGGRSGKPRQKPAASQGPAEAFARTEDSRRQIAASMPHASGPIDRRPRPHLSKRPRKRPWDGQLRRRKCTKRNCGAGEAPQERRRGCTRTPRR